MVAWLALGCTADPTGTPPPDGSGVTATGDTGTTPVDTDTGPTDTGTPPYTMSGFSFVDDTLAGMPQPGRVVPLEQDLAFLDAQGIGLLVSLTETPTDPVAVEAAGLDLLHLPIPDFTPPTLDQQQTFVDAVWLRVAAADKVGVHDTAGLGRCGTMLATWFVAKGMDAETAIAEIRALRPGSIETDEQEQAVYDYAAAIGAGRRGFPGTGAFGFPLPER
ncbi:MAG: hypothetical protein ABMB14_22090 [Myxococcota bacterium]